MPRPKVRLEDRQRAVKACLPCKASKKRCDAQQPCSNCIRRRATSFCHYIDSGYVRHTRKRSQPQPAESSACQDEAVSTASEDLHFAVSKPLEEISGDVDITPREARPSRGRMLLNSKGERVYIGEFASLTFLQFLRHTIKQQMGPSLFTENTRRNLMLEAANVNDTVTQFVEDVHQKAALIEAYFAATNGIIDLFSRDEVAALKHASNENEHKYVRAALDLMVSIGAQCRAEDALDHRYASTLFSRAQKAIMADGLEDPSIDMVRCFLLMTFYMLGACRRNAAFMYLGIASQASSALGLHVTEQYRHFSVEDQIVRLRTLRSLRVLDVTYCSILGRPYSTVAISAENTAIAMLRLPPVTNRDSTLQASFEVCSIIAEITPMLDFKGSISLSTAEGFLKRLRDWSAALPADMRHFNRSADESLTPEEQERTIGNIHVSCTYYFAVMLVTRPFLITYLMAHMSNGASPVTTGTEIAELAQACIDSAILMANMCNEALQSDILFKQMCILKAWIFAAGLVLGFSMFAQGDSRFDMDDSFSNAREVLRSLSAESPQAEHYYEILMGFADVIQRRRQHLSRGRRSSRNKYVDQILTFDVTPSASRSQSTLSPGTPQSRGPGQGMPDASATDDGAGDFEFQMPDLSQWPLENGGGFDFGMFGWDNFAMQISENFSFDNDSSWGVT
ncbi:putative Fungal specific transcription factor [Cladophialophora carrionii]|uniref:Putative Fungal specific transcription factor n=1 Tax=Cladophialophora carrionii TaxID=86049 RepID=A0A1C1CC40_9EURO|nr:putative Fungal specific transcription factor [Cladophialophora carrionii]